MSDVINYESRAGGIKILYYTMQLQPSTAKEITQRIKQVEDIDVTHEEVSNRLVTLYRSGYVVRRKAPNPVGGAYQYAVSDLKESQE